MVVDCSAADILRSVGFVDMAVGMVVAVGMAVGMAVAAAVAVGMAAARSQGHLVLVGLVLLVGSTRLKSPRGPVVPMAVPLLLPR